MGLMGRGYGRLIHSDFVGATLTLAVSPSLTASLPHSLPLSVSPSPLLNHPLLPISPVTLMYASIFFFCLPPLAQRALRWVRLRWDAERLAQPVQLQPVSGLEGQEPVVRRQRSAL